MPFGLPNNFEEELHVRYSTTILDGEARAFTWTLEIERASCLIERLILTLERKIERVSRYRVLDSDGKHFLTAVSCER